MCGKKKRVLQDTAGSDCIKRLLRVSYVEIYKEELRDLLHDESYVSNKEIHIREDEDGRTGMCALVEQGVSGQRPVV